MKETNPKSHNAVMHRMIQKRTKTEKFPQNDNGNYFSQTRPSRATIDRTLQPESSKESQGERLTINVSIKQHPHVPKLG